MSMPYTCVKRGNKWVLSKKDGSKDFGEHDSEADCKSQMRALYAEETRKPENIRFDGFVSLPWDFDQKIANAKDVINVVLNSEGGSFVDAIIIHNKLRNAGKPIHVYVESFAFSAAADIMLAGDKIFIAENGLIYFHQPMIEMYGVKGADDLESMATSLRKLEEVLVNTVKTRTKLSEEECRKMICNETWFTPQEALAAGLVDEIVPILRETTDVQNHVKLENKFPERILNFLKERPIDMSSKTLCDKYGLTATPENADQVLSDYINGLQPPKPANIGSGILNMIKRARESELNTLVTSGKVIPAVVNELKIQFLDDKRIAHDAQTENQDFEKVINALAKNDTVINFKGKSGVQTLPKDSGVKDDNNENDVLVKNMKSRTAS